MILLIEQEHEDEKKEAPVADAEDFNTQVIREFRENGGKVGAPTNPDWYHNLAAHPDTTIEVGAGTVKVSAREAGPEERAPIWEKQKETYPQFAAYEETSGDRQIPVILLDPEA